MQNHSTVLDQTTWGIHLNFEGYFASPPNCPSWLTQLQQQDWQQRGIVVWNANLHIVTHLCAGYALELLEHLQSTDAWKFEGLVIGSPAFQLSSSHATTPTTKIGGELVLRNQIELSANQAQAFVEFLMTQESLLKRISAYEKENAKQALSEVYRLIAAYGRRIREGKGREGRKLIEDNEPKIIPTSIPVSLHLNVVTKPIAERVAAWQRRVFRVALALSLTVLICTRHSRLNVYHLGVWHNASSQLEAKHEKETYESHSRYHPALTTGRR